MRHFALWGVSVSFSILPTCGELDVNPGSSQPSVWRFGTTYHMPGNAVKSELAIGSCTGELGSELELRQTYFVVSEVLKTHALTEERWN